MLGHRRTGITLLEVLVVIAIIVVLMGLLMPAMQSSHTEYRRTECANNLRNLALAAVQYEVANGELPGYLHDFGTFPGGTDPSEPLGDGYPAEAHAKIGTWAVTLMPYLGHQPTYEHWTEDKYPLLSSVSTVDGTYNRRALPNLPTFICPKSVGEAKGIARNSYVANCGVTGTTPLPFAEASKTANGAFNNKYGGPSMLGDATSTGPPVRIDHFRDGTSTTLLFTENLQAQSWHRISFEPMRANLAPSQVMLNPRKFLEPNLAKHYTGIVWHHYDREYSAPPPPQVLINSDRSTAAISSSGTDQMNALYARPSSAHRSGVNASFADGGVRFVSDDIDYRTYQALLTLHGKDSNVPHPGFVPSPDAL
ncbi:DUF1559 family PulG-like putative transporter [Candidatus Laterigemmans baculatus]|uniref:DUF1559 family PulG-like putative transporter n=1 Tax=Candidatus Laterigemmans baculatus TaxID=2770505 RepID=UPI0013DBE642|nr:DUF1559 domain-containing protein [Candidatus Laterigemmans baculatus]